MTELRSRILDAYNIGKKSTAQKTEAVQAMVQKAEKSEKTLEKVEELRADKKKPARK
jgi:hypothetical protein